MTDWVVDSSVVAKWVLPESDSQQARQLIAACIDQGGHLIVLDRVFPEVANAIWKQHHQHKITVSEAEKFLADLLRLPVQIEPALAVLGAALDVAMKYDRAVYDALFVALARSKGLQGVTADEPLYSAIGKSFPEIKLLRNL
jgi:predicted nucleic acid-binding protein